MRYVYGLLLAVACGCGGGGGGAPNPGAGLQATAQLVLEACGVGQVEDFVELLPMFEGLLDPNETNPQQFMVFGVDPVGATVSWGLDLDGDLNPDLMGSFTFTDDLGDPEAAADVNQLAGGFDDLDTMIASLPDGTRLAVTAATTPLPTLSAVSQFIIIGGAVDSVDWSMTSQDPDCQANLDFLGASLQDVGGDYPTVTATFSVSNADGALTGTITFDGTNEARVEVTLDGDPEVFAFIINLDTSAVSPAP